jgi:hypothetical protein
MKPTANWTKASIGLFASIIFVFSLVTGAHIENEVYKWTTTAMSAATLLVLAFDKWIWRWPGVKAVINYLRMPPVLHGTWAGEIQYDKDSKGSSGKIPVYLVIRQTFTDLKMISYVSTSESSSLTAEISKNEHGSRQLAYAYRTLVPYGTRKDNPSTDGLAVLGIVGSPVRELSGSYFTDRGGSGRIVLSAYSPKLAESFSDAEQLSYKKY